MKDISCEVYNALGDIMFKTQASREDMEKALKFFMFHFFEDAEDYEEEN